MTYPILSKGDGADLNFIFLMILIISLAVNGLQSISTSRVEGVGIHDGWLDVVVRDRVVHLREVIMGCILIEGRGDVTRRCTI